MATIFKLNFNCIFTFLRRRGLLTGFSASSGGVTWLALGAVPVDSVGWAMGANPLSGFVMIPHRAKFPKPALRRLLLWQHAF